MDSEDTVMILYSSGTTGKPKGTLHTHGGSTAQIVKELGYAFDVKPTDRFPWVTDIGWMMGPWQFIGVPHEIKGQTPVCFVILQPNREPSEELRELPEARRMVEPLGDGRYRITGSGLERWLRRRVFQLFLATSRVRGIMRWPKFLLTVDEWVDIMLAKIERTKGIKLEPSEMTRRYPLLLGWPYFFQLLRAGAIGSFSTLHDKNSFQG